MKVLFQDQLIEREHAKVDIEDRGYQFGDGVYEVIRIYNGKMFTSDGHLDRLYESAKKISITIPYQKEKIKDLLHQLIAENELKHGIVYMQITRGTSPRNHVFPDASIEPVLTASTKEYPRPTELMEQGIKVITLEDIRWLRCDIKSLNLLGNVLAKQKAVDVGCFEAIQHRNGTVTEGSSSNVSIVKDGLVFTHPANHLILNGISRQVMLTTCEKSSIPLKEESFSLEQLMNADEVFISGTTVEITPVVEIDGIRIGEGKMGPITSRLQTLFRAEIESECGNL
ncbi:D-amino-acid transaminase [Peribacillus alkalitolerans]|uniref:D-amino-acid transaminase n=1 Tax=Peribacillus alkalitolerans TaxID=1550385 RepID=UPI001F085492|nr:D-amino-acid transaminase [Peribacillus alkalitolerans]